MISTLTLLLCALWLCFVHYIADFFCQSHMMSISKSSSNRWLTLHVSIYTLVLFIGMTFMYYRDTAFSPLPWRLYVFVLLNGILHWITDYFTSRLNKKLWLSGMNPDRTEKTLHWFFNGVGIDQYIHYATLFTTAYWLLL